MAKKNDPRENYSASEHSHYARAYFDVAKIREDKGEHDDAYQHISMASSHLNEAVRKRRGK